MEPTIKQILHTADGITDKPMETTEERLAAVEKAAGELCDAASVVLQAASSLNGGFNDLEDRLFVAMQETRDFLPKKEAHESKVP